MQYVTRLLKAELCLPVQQYSLVLRSGTAGRCHPGVNRRSQSVVARGKGRALANGATLCFSTSEWLDSAFTLTQHPVAFLSVVAFTFLC